MLKKRFLGGRCALALFFFSWFSSQLKAEEWPPLTPEEQSMTTSPISPGAAAILLRREVDSDDNQSIEKQFYRIKILTEEGRKYADISIPYVKGATSIDNMKARVVRPNGTVVAVNPEVFEKTVAKSGGVKILTKTFTIPEAGVGSIIDYKFNFRWDETRLRSPEWILQHELPTLHAKFGFKAYSQLAVAWTAKRLPGGVAPVQDKNSVFRLSLDNIPAFVEENYAPPESVLQMKVEFFYFRRPPESVDKFWKDEAKDWSDSAEAFIGRRKGVAAAAAQLVATADSPEAKLRKLYERAQQVRNLTWERAKSEKESKREKLKDNNNVEDVLEHGYGYRTQINRLFVALARAAGFDAAAVRVSERDAQFFDMNLLDGAQLDGELAVVRLGERELYLDPGTPTCPFGLVYWPKTGVKAVRLGEKGGQWLVTPQPEAKDARIERSAQLDLDDQGTLRGTIQVTYSGQSALSRRLDNRNNDEAGRKKEIEDEIKGWLPSAATFKLEEITGWEGAEEPLLAKGSIEIPDFGVATGSRLLVSMSLFASESEHPFAASHRVHPVYFEYPYETIDQVELQVPQGRKVDGLPEAHRETTAFGQFELSVSAEEGVIRAKRRLAFEGFVFPVEHYASLRAFYAAVRGGDEQQAVLRADEVDHGQ